MSQKILSSAFAALVALALAACDKPTATETDDSISPTQPQSSSNPKLGLMTSLPLYWPLDASFEEIARGKAERPWQRELIEQKFELVPLDTLSPIPGLSPDDSDTDPLEELDYLAIIQPRGLSPLDNVALDDWVRDGGHLLLLLDPQLTGEYDIPLGDPRRPVDIALEVPVVTRWGLVGSYNPSQFTDVSFAQLPDGPVPILMAGESRVVVVDGGLNGCRTHDSLVLARCDKVGKGTVTYLHDAAVFEHRELAGENGESIAALLQYAFQ